MDKLELCHFHNGTSEAKFHLSVMQESWGQLYLHYFTLWVWNSSPHQHQQIAIIVFTLQNRLFLVSFTVSQPPKLTRCLQEVWKGFAHFSSCETHFIQHIQIMMAFRRNVILKSYEEQMYISVYNTVHYVWICDCPWQTHVHVFTSIRDYLDYYQRTCSHHLTV